MFYEIFVSPKCETSMFYDVFDTPSCETNVFYEDFVNPRCETSVFCVILTTPEARMRSPPRLASKWPSLYKVMKRNGLVWKA